MIAYRLSATKAIFYNEIAMKIYDLVEQANLDCAILNDQARWLINQEYTPQQWIGITQVFLTNLDQPHTVPGNVVYSLTDICDQYQHTQSITLKQLLYISNNLVDHWHNLSCLARAQFVSQ
jgi:hypothetical protein